MFLRNTYIFIGTGTILHVNLLYFFFELFFLHFTARDLETSAPVHNSPAQLLSIRTLVLKLYSNRKFQKVQESLRKSTFFSKNVV